MIVDSLLYARIGDVFVSKKFDCPMILLTKTNTVTVWLKPDGNTHKTLTIELKLKYDR